MVKKNDIKPIHDLTIGSCKSRHGLIRDFVARRLEGLNNLNTYLENILEYDISDGEKDSLKPIFKELSKVQIKVCKLTNLCEKTRTDDNLTEFVILINELFYYMTPKGIDGSYKKLFHDLANELNNPDLFRGNLAAEKLGDFVDQAIIKTDISRLTDILGNLKRALQPLSRSELLQAQRDESRTGDISH